MADAEVLSRQFAALADPVRLWLLSLLARASGGSVCACELAGPAGKSQPTVSHHLKVLSEAGLVTSERRGRNIWYAVVPAALAALREVLAPGRRVIAPGPAASRFGPPGAAVRASRRARAPRIGRSGRPRHDTSRRTTRAESALYG